MLIRRELRLKAGLPKDFPNKAFHYPSLYGLKSFEQLQTECKVASVLCFSNAGGVLGCLFNYKSLDLQILGWSPIHLLCHPIRLRINLDLSIGTKVGELVFSTMAELQAIALALECVSPDSSVVVYSNSQAVLDACVAESVLVSSDFCNCC
ncbi:hypothetical protein G9A89_008046 [Geosiphon pyriformis]|nr:hypothetical protein G9A89_008046 [Geosiphon pyriformis]